MYDPIFIVCRYRYAAINSRAGPFWESITREINMGQTAQAIDVIRPDPLTIAIVVYRWTLDRGVERVGEEIIDKRCYFREPTSDRPQQDKLKGLIMSYIQDHIFACSMHALHNKPTDPIKEQPCPKKQKT